jgi:hypothetical protein
MPPGHCIQEWRSTQEYVRKVCSGHKVRSGHGLVSGDQLHLWPVHSQQRRRTRTETRFRRLDHSTAPRHSGSDTTCFLFAREAPLQLACSIDNCIPFALQKLASCIVLFRPGLAWKPRLWPGLRRLRLSKFPGQAQAVNSGLAGLALAQAAAFDLTFFFLNLKL